MSQAYPAKSARNLATLDAVVELLAAVVLVVLLVVAAAVSVVLLGVHALVARNRVVPGCRTGAPLTWLVAPDRAAQLHRRLRAAVVVAGFASDPRSSDLGLDDVVARLRERALELDQQLVMASRSPKPSRRRMLRELQSEVAELERLAERAMRMSRAWTGTSPSERGLSTVRERLELLEAALRELDGIDVRTSGPSAAPLRRHPER